MTLKELIIKYLNNNKELFTTHKAYVLPDIPEDKLETVKNNQPISQQEEILWVVDITFSGNAEDTLIFTESGIYFHQKLMGVLTEKNVLWAEIDEFFYDRKKGFVIINSKGEEIVYDRMHLDVYYKKETDLIDARIKLLEQIKEFLELKPQEVPISNIENEFINDVKFMLYNDGIIEDTEKSILNSLSKNYQLQPERAEELVKSVVEQYQTSPEKLYLDEIYKIIETKNEFSDSDNRALDFFAEKLKIDKQTSEKLKQIAIDKNNKQ